MPRRLAPLAVALCLVPALAPAQTFTTAAEVRPILTATQPQWIAVRLWDGQDLLYFANLLAWRCGVKRISYAINGADTLTPLKMEPCHEGEAAPNALKVTDILPYVAFGPNEIETITVEVLYDDGGSVRHDYARAAVAIQ